MTPSLPRARNTRCMPPLPSGTVTFVFSDIESSTTLLKRLGDTDYGTLLSVHRRLVREIFEAHDGQEIDTQGDAFFYSFVRARQAVAAAIELQRAHVKASWPGGVEVRVRLGLHTGEPAIGDEGYTGLDVVRASRIAAVGAGGQVLLSDTTRSIVAGDLGDGVSVRSIGERKLKDIDRPEPIFELMIDDVEAGPVEGPVEEKAEPSSGGLFDRTRQTIEARVLAQLEESLGRGFPFAPPTLGQPPARSATREIARLHELREKGALTDEQYQRAVDRLLEDR
jgi:class 3 adenylate cyclase